MIETQEKPTFFKNGKIYNFGTDKPSARYPKLPAGIYLVGFHMAMGFYVEEILDFELPNKLYGNIESRADRILNTYENRPKSTGVLLSGQKGSGKTLLTKLISMKAKDLGYPVLVVNNAFQGDAFNTFLQNVDQPCVVLFDEFEKVYDDEEQQGLLTLFEGVFPTKKLFLLTTNDSFKINSHFHNRPGRLYYALDFKGLDTDFIVEYGKENLKNQDHLQGLSVITSLVNPLSFDILQAIVEECNRYNESPIEVLDILNVKSESGYAEEFTVSLKLLNGKKLYRLIDCEDNTLRVNPFKYFALNYEATSTVKGKTKKDYHAERFYPKDLIGFNGITGVYQFKTKNVELTLKRKQSDDRTIFSRYEGLLVD